MKGTFEDPRMTSAALEAQTGFIGRYWTDVRIFIDGCQGPLRELELLLHRVAGRSGSAWSKPIRAVKLSFSSSDIAYYTDEIKDFKANAQLSLQMIVVCCVVESSNSNTKTDPDLRSTETTIRQLQAEVQSVKSATAEPVRRKPLDIEASSAQVSGSDDNKSSLGADIIRKRRPHTANSIETCLSSAAELLSTASTVTAEGRLSPVEETSQDPAHWRATIGPWMETSTDVSPASKPKGSSSHDALWLLPRFIGSLLWVAALLLGIGLAFVYRFFWLTVQIFCGFRRFDYDKARLRRDLGVSLDWLLDRWHDIW